MIELANLKDLREIPHGFLTRRGGVSEGLYSALNCGLGSSDDPAAVVENRTRALRSAGREPLSLAAASQARSARVAVVDDDWDEAQRPQVDGLVSRARGKSL